MPKKLQKQSIYAEYDQDGDGIITDEELVSIKQIKQTSIVLHRNPNVKEKVNLSSSNNSGVPKSKFKYANNAINIAANLAPGIPNNMVGIIEVAFCELFAPSGPMTPLILPLPKGILSFGLVATV